MTTSTQSTSTQSTSTQSTSTQSAELGIPASALEFYTDLELNNNRQWWLAHKADYQMLVREPIMAALEPLIDSFGRIRFFRPYRDQRFWPNKPPYKTAQGVFVSTFEGVGFYLFLDAAGITLAGGYNTTAPAQLARFRAAVDASSSGEALAAILRDLAERGFTFDGEQLKTVPHGFNRNHPRAELLKFKTLRASIHPGVPEWLSTEQCSMRIETIWEQLRPLVNWILRFAAP